MPYLDGTPSPEDEQPARKADDFVSIEIDEPEQMIADLLNMIRIANGRKIESIRVSWVDMTNVDSPAPDIRVRRVEVDSVVEVDWVKEPRNG